MNKAKVIRRHDKVCADRLEKVLAEERERVKKLIQDELLICALEGTPTSRLTSLYMKVVERRKDE